MTLFIISWNDFVHGAAPSCTASQLKYSPTDEGNAPELTPRTHSPSPSRTDKSPEPSCDPITFSYLGFS